MYIHTHTLAYCSTAAEAGLSSDIPGFFYDPETKKYFKIAAGQHAYSVESVREKAKVCTTWRLSTSPLRLG